VSPAGQVLYPFFIATYNASVLFLYISVYLPNGAAICEEAGDKVVLGAQVVAVCVAVSTASSGGQFKTG
jgi:hypothetical protein